MANKDGTKSGGKPLGYKANHTILVAEARKNLIDAYLKKQTVIDAKLVELAEEGEIQAIKELYDRVYGKSLQTNEVRQVKEYKLDDEKVNELANELTELQKQGKYEGIRGLQR